MKGAIIIILLMIMGCTTGRDVRPDNIVNMRGMFISYTDNSEIIRCGNGQRISIRGGRAYEEIEIMYQKSGVSPGEMVYVEVEGRYELIERADGYGTQLVFFVDRVLFMDKDLTCF